MDATTGVALFFSGCPYMSNPLQNFIKLAHKSAFDSISLVMLTPNRDY
jgi:hypothetical protein